VKRKIIFKLFCILLFSSQFLKAQSYFKVENDFPCGGCGQYTADLGTLKVYTESEAKAIFTNVVNSGIEFGYPQGGCQQRAQITHLLLANKFHISHARVWIFAPKDLISGDNTQLEINDPNQLVSGGIIKWSYHVACVIMAKNSTGSTDTLVIDPAIKKENLVNLKEWLGKMKNSNVSKYTFLNPQWYFFNTQNNGSSPIINGYFYEYSDVPGNTNTNFNKLTLERELAINDVAVFLKKKLDQGATDDGSIKKLLSNVEAMINFFSSQERLNTSINGITIRQLINSNPQLMENAMSYFATRLVFHTTEVQKYLN